MGSSWWSQTGLPIVYSVSALVAVIYALFFVRTLASAWLSWLELDNGDGIE